MCDEGYRLIGTDQRVCQADGTWSLDQPECRKTIYCEAPPNVHNAQHNAPKHAKHFELDTTLQYSCMSGYTTNGFSRAKCIRYNGTAHWFGPDIECQPISCGDPGHVSNGYREVENFQYNSRVKYICMDGYELSGRSMRTCRESGLWSGTLPSCLAVHCPYPDSPANGRSVYESTAYNSVVRYKCQEGYVSIGQSERRCLADKQWSGEKPFCKGVAPTSKTSDDLPTAIEIDCGTPGPLYNGILMGNSTVQNSVINFRCNDGMKFEGVAKFTTCQESGQWSNPLPKCLAPCVAPEVENGCIRELSAGDKVDHGDDIHIECNKDYELTYNVTPARCSNGTWTIVPKCVPARCKKLPPRPRHGMVIAPKTEHGMKAKFRCKDGFILNGNNITECHYGQWTGEMPHCMEVFCSHPGNVEHGKVLLVGNMGLYDYRSYVRKVTNNRQIMFECNKGYTLVDGPPGATCIGNRWSPKQLPRCVLGQHPRLRWYYRRKKRRAMDENGGHRVRSRNQRKTRVPCKVPYGHNGHYSHRDKVIAEGYEISHGETVSYSCITGFQLQGTELMRCLFGEWSSESLPQCIPGPCELPHITNGHYTSGYRAGLTIAHGSTIEYDCENDYTKTTLRAITCHLGQLKPRVPACRHKSVQVIPVLSKTGIQEADIHYKHPGSDISVIDFPATLKSSCSPPERVQNALVYKEGAPLNENDRRFPDGTEVHFNCITGITGERSSWKIVCEDGKWVGMLHVCETGELNEEFQYLLNKSCIYRNTEPNLMTFYGDMKVTDELTEFPPGAEIVSRCSDIGKYALIGSVRRRCINGEWDGVKPACFGLSQENDYALEKPPTILFRHQLGPIAQSNDGKLIVYPGTILHLECLWLRKYGTPKWETTHSYRKYPEGWTGETGRDSQLEYRLSVYHAQRDDSGVYTCTTPMGHRHSVELIVRAVHCPRLPERNGLHSSTLSNKMNTKVVFSCKNSNALIGAEQATCLPSGNWSNPTPICESVRCPGTILLPNPTLKIQILSREVGGRAVFSCKQGHSLRGPTEAFCEMTGLWSLPFPTCESQHLSAEVRCTPPAVPENGYTQNSGIHKAGDVVQYSCNQGYMMEGQAIIVCQENGRWSGAIPKCLQACTYPGTTIGGTISVVKFYYSVGESVTFECTKGLQLRGARMLRCQANGKWSNAIPLCVPEES
ncbi:hypothetical protein CHUAL_008903 [Chamberlinius hualienensis]